uniref:Accessory gene regulator protein A n=1 Tax=Listeria monocytogenes TaxID=1639 RepID=A8E0G4_LISMN|nr:accessory gene regulator protein A [Listeria monocytogenes]
MSSNRRSV